MVTLHELERLLSSQRRVKKLVHTCISNNVVQVQKPDHAQIDAHIHKALYNLRFVSDVLKLKYLDWTISGLYYACYHAVLGLILTKGYRSRSHTATLYILILEFYSKYIQNRDVQFLARILDLHDMQFYVHTKNLRQKASYHTSTAFTKHDVSKLQIQGINFINKIQTIIK